MKPVAPKDTPEVGGGTSYPWTDTPELIPLVPTPPINPIGEPIVSDPTCPNPDLT
jgi:hypothetical protein